MKEVNYLTANFKDTLRYWAKMVGYVFLLAVLTGVFAGPGVMLISPTYLSGASVVPGIGLLLVGVIVLISGLFGILYKVISDGVEEGKK